MIPTLRVLIHMGSLQRLLPFWIGGLVTLILGFSPLLLLAPAAWNLELAASSWPDDWNCTRSPCLRLCRSSYCCRAFSSFS